MLACIIFRKTVDCFAENKACVIKYDVSEAHKKKLTRLCKEKASHIQALRMHDNLKQNKEPRDKRICFDEISQRPSFEV